MARVTEKWTRGPGDVQLAGPAAQELSYSYIMQSTDELSRGVPVMAHTRSQMQGLAEISGGVREGRQFVVGAVNRRGGLRSEGRALICDDAAHGRDLVERGWWLVGIELARVRRRVRKVSLERVGRKDVVVQTAA